jgi:Homeodomain-like domain
VADVAAALGISSRTVEHIKQRLVEKGLEAALVRKPHHKPRDVTFDGSFDARLTALACSPALEGYQRWTVRFLADKLVELKIVDAGSVMTVQRSLKKRVAASFEQILEDPARRRRCLCRCDGRCPERRRIPDIESMRRQTSAGQSRRNNRGAPLNWRFTTEDARLKLLRLYPIL